MRLFFAVHVGPSAVEAAAAVRRVAEASDPDVATRGLRWVAPAQLHLTVRFLGEVAPDLAARVISALAPPIALAPFDLSLGTAAWLPGPRRPRVLVLPVVGGADRLAELKQAIDARLPGDVPPDEARQYRPHLTLARVRDGWDRRLGGLASAIGTHGAASNAGRVDEAALYESHLGPTGPVYDRRARIFLAGHPS